MRDIIWTLIIVWFIYRLFELFKGVKQKNYVYSETRRDQAHYKAQTAQPKRDVKSAVNRSVDKEGDYVDFEEVK